MGTSQVMEISGSVTARSGRALDWQRWAPYAAVAWSLLYAALGIAWALGAGGFPYTPAAASSGMGPLLGRFGSAAGWTGVLLAGVPAAVLGVAMLRGARGRVLRPLFILAGGLLSGALLLLMTGLDLLVALGYVPYTLKGLLTGADVSRFVAMMTQWTNIHQLVCLLGGFLWLAATVVYARRSGEACLYCGRREEEVGWQSPEQAARWGRVAVIVGLVPPVLYAAVRYAWALGIPLGLTPADIRNGQQSGIWIGGAFLASFGVVGALLMLGLVQRWGEVFPRWIPFLGKRRVPIALAVVPAAIVSVLLVVGGIVISTDLSQMAANLAATGVKGAALVSGVIFQVGPTLLFPVWGVALAVAALGYYFRRRGPCKVCGRGAVTQPAK